jgi:selenoprotein W-related protein
VADLLKSYESQIESITLIPSSGGVFEVTVDDSRIFSKAALGRHAEPGEIARLLNQYLKGKRS